MRKVLRVCGQGVLLSMLCLAGLSAPSYAQMATPFCDDFDDGNGWESRWTVGLHTAVVVPSPVHSGAQALKLRGVNGDCHAYVYRTDFEACTGEYSAWVNQQHFQAGLGIFIQVQPGPGTRPYERDSYYAYFSARNSQMGNMVLQRYEAAGTYYILASRGDVAFDMDEWVRIFVRRLPGNSFVVGYERNGIVDSIVASDPNPPIADPGAFYLWSCSDGPLTDNFFDDACYHDLPCSMWPANDLNCDGVINVQDVVSQVNVAFRGGPELLPCAARCD